MKRILFLFFSFVLLGVMAVQAQVTFSVSTKRVSPTEIDVVFTGRIAPGWHVYGTGIAPGGPTAATFGTDVLKGAKLKGALRAGAGLKHKQDPIFDMPVTFFEGSAQFTQRIELTDKQYEVKGYLKYGACNDENCLPPTTVEMSAKGKDGPEKALADNAASNSENQAGTPTADNNAPTLAAALPGDPGATTDSVDTAIGATAPAKAQVAALDSATIRQLWSPVTDQLRALGEDHGAAGKSLLIVFGLGFLGGLLALVTPCVWPIIPMTVSFFLKRNSDRAKGVRDALTYGASIVVIYVLLGLVITTVFGASALNDLSTNAIFNIAFFLMLVLFGASFLGGFEIQLPTSWGNAIDTKASNTTGLLSIFLMAFTLALVSFSCTGPIIGFLLVEVSTSGGGHLAPTVGMLGFAVALALPFTLFALFPSLLKKTTRGGSWMNKVKVTLGFVELAFALKFFSVADLAYGWHLLDREVFLALWIALFALLAAYLFGWVKFPHDDADERSTSVPAFFVGIASLAFAIYMVPGLWGAPVKAVSAFAPPIETQDFNLNTKVVKAHYTDYETGMAAAKAMNKPVLIDFTGYGCTNCRKMESAVWTDPRVMEMLEKDYVLISLYVDDNKRLPQEIEIMENGQKRTLRTVADKWSYLQRSKFGANTQPFYVPIDNDGNPLVGSYSYNEDIPAYIKFLQKGLKAYQKKK